MKPPGQMVEETLSIVNFCCLLVKIKYIEKKCKFELWEIQTNAKERFGHYRNNNKMWHL